MVKFGKKFFFDAKYEKKTKRKLIIIGSIVLVAVIILIIILISIFKKNNNSNNPKINNNILLRQVVNTEVNKALPDKTSYFEKLANTDLDKITLTYPDNLEIGINADDCPKENLEAINNILDKTSDEPLENYTCIKYVPVKTGTYDVLLNYNNKDYTIKLNVKDLTAPSLVLKNVEITAGDSYSVNDFVESCKDNYDAECVVNYYYNSYEDTDNTLDYSTYTEEGTYDIKIAAGDSNGNLSLPLTTTLTVKPKAPNKYLITFDSAGGSTINGEYVEEGHAVAKPANPKRNGYTFKGWRLNGQTYDFGSQVNSDITLVAEWSKNSSSQVQNPMPGCTYGNKKYNTNNYVLSVYANAKSDCATKKSDYNTLRDGPLTQNIIATDQNKLIDHLSKQYGGNIPYNAGYEVEGVFNTANTGLVGYQITVIIRTTNNNTEVARYRINTNGKRQFSLNTINLPQ